MIEAKDNLPACIKRTLCLFSSTGDSALRGYRERKRKVRLSAHDMPSIPMARALVVSLDLLLVHNTVPFPYPTPLKTSGNESDGEERWIHVKSTIPDCF